MSYEVIEVYEVKCRDGKTRYLAYLRNKRDYSLVITRIRREEAEEIGVDETIAEDELSEEEREVLYAED